MLHTIRAITASLLGRLLPAHGSHRSAGVPTAVGRPDTLKLVLPQAPAGQPLQGEDGPLIRPYVLTPEERRERRLQRGRRRALWLAVHGFDAGPRWIHGAEVVS